MILRRAILSGSVTASVFLVFSFAAFSQETRRDSVSVADTLETLEETNVENLLEQATQDGEESTLLDRLQRLEEFPIDLNDASIEELQVIPGITPAIARNIVVTRDSLEGFRTFSELQRIDGIDDQLYALLKKYARVTPRAQNELNLNYRSRTSRDLKTRKGFEDGTYAGSPWKAYNRLLVNYGPTFSAGLLTDKDPGETKVNDFLSGFLMLRTKRPLLQIVAGDYFLEAAQGVTVWRSLGFSKGLDVILPARKTPRGLSSYVSSDESNFYRGVAGAVSLSGVDLSGFYSNKKVDASVDSSGNVTSISGFGTHRTESELRRRLALQEEAAGGRVALSLGGAFRLGSTFHSVRYDKPFLAKRLYDFSGREAHILGIDYDVVWKGFNLFGEWARSHTRAIGGISGLSIRFSKGWDFVLSVRRYPRDFISLHGYAFGQRNGATQNEYGIYTGLRVRLSPTIRLSAYYDQFEFPWRTAAIPLPIRGTDFLLAADLRPVRKFVVELKYKSEKKGDAVTAEDEFGRDITQLVDRSQRNGRVTATLDVSRKLRLRGRVELVKVEYSAFAGGQKGILLYQDLRWRPFSRLTVDARLIFFDTDSYDSRIYEYESELRGTLFNPALYGKGRRWYVVARYIAFGVLEISAKYSETYRDDLKRIGSGPDEIPGNVDNRLSGQVDVRF